MANKITKSEKKLIINSICGLPKDKQLSIGYIIYMHNADLITEVSSGVYVDMDKLDDDVLLSILNIVRIYK